jgi:hypothetical protein
MIPNPWRRYDGTRLVRAGGSVREHSPPSTALSVNVKVLYCGCAWALPTDPPAPRAGEVKTLHEFIVTHRDELIARPGPRSPFVQPRDPPPTSS